MNRSLTTLIWGGVAALGALATGTWDRTKRDGAFFSSGNRTGDLVVAHPALAVKIQHDVYAALRCYVEAVPGELTLLGTVQSDIQRNEIRVDQLLLPSQRSSSAQTEVSEQALAELLVEAVQQGIDTARLKVWLHSHGQMEAFFSTTDQSSMDTAFPQADWILSIVTNRAGQVKARLSLYRPFRLDVDDLPVTVGLPAELEETIRAEVAAKVHQGYDHYGEQSHGAGRQLPRDTGGAGRSSVLSGSATCDSRSSVDWQCPHHVGDD
jgi:proteasome lid subunit RPN8/RPN11